MQLIVLNDTRDVIWVKTKTGGLTSLSFRQDGTLDQITELLKLALEQAQAEAVSDGDLLSVAEQNSAALDGMLERQLLVDVSHDPVPNPGRLEEGVPGRGRSEVNAIPGLPDRNNVPCEVCARRGKL